ncbi:T-lymphocyte activation antigen CD86 isoform X5 [Manis javanica]|uniref:T-lymphocyte activation antigen CD86 isoform X5 n=1 Tax=Manis javanica TaxID=9974 RepID=UPI000812FDD7|nr:T-lymphocyte activation antigen CD86 isoform X5 [Manis javanica]
MCLRRLLKQELNTMGLSGTLCMMALLLSGAASMKSQAYFDKTGNLPCHFTNSQNISLEELVVFWQKQHKLVLYELYKGKEKPDNVHPKYKGRTSFDQDNWTLRLHNLQIKDEGLYQCFVHHQGPKGLIPIYQMSSELSVVANFSQPEIMLISNRTENSDTIINLTCSSMEGYPEPKEMYFILEKENSTTKYDAVMKKSQNNITELYSISISFSFTIPSETNNVSIYCVLQLEAMETQLLSSPYNIDAKPPKEHHPDKGHILPIVALLVTLVAVCGMVFFLTLKKRKKQQPDSSHEHETTKMGEKENEQSEERIEYQVSVRSAEAQSVVNTLKTASEDKSATDF